MTVSQARVDTGSAGVAEEPGTHKGARRQLGLHAAALLAGLALLVALGGPRTAVSSDEGAGIHQAALLQRGGWLVEPTLPELDPDLVRQPFYNADGGPQGRAPYAKHPAYPLLLEGAARAWWPHGLVVPGILGTWLAALAAALLARALRAALAVPTLWLVGLGSPLTVDAHLVLAHAPAAATAAVAALAAAVAVVPESFGRRASARWVAPAAIGVAMLAAAATVALRSEGTLLVGGLVLGVLAAGSSWRRSMPLAAALVAATVATRLSESVVVESILGRGAAAPSPPSSSSGFLAARLQAFQASWLDLGYFDGRGEPLLGVGSCALLLAILGSRWGVRPGLVRGLAATAVVGSLAWLLLGGVGLVPGLLPATPWLVAGLAQTRLSILRTGLARLLVVASATAGGAILATQYSFGGGVEWGGRFYAVVLPLAAPAVIAAVWPPDPGGWRSGSPPIALVVVLVTALVSIGGLVAVRSSHAKTAALGREVATAARAAPPGRPGDPDRRVVVVGPQRLWPQLLWPHFDEYRWVTVDRDRLPCALHDLRRAAFERVVLLGPLPEDLVGLAEEQGWRRVAEPAGRFSRVVESGPAGASAPPTCPPGRGSL